MFIVCKQMTTLNLLIFTTEGSQLCIDTKDRKYENFPDSKIWCEKKFQDTKLRNFPECPQSFKSVCKFLYGAQKLSRMWRNFQKIAIFSNLFYDHAKTLRITKTFHQAMFEYLGIFFWLWLKHWLKSIWGENNLFIGEFYK